MKARKLFITRPDTAKKNWTRAHAPALLSSLVNWEMWVERLKAWEAAIIEAAKTLFLVVLLYEVRWHSTNRRIWLANITPRARILVIQFSNFRFCGITLTNQVHWIIKYLSLLARATGTPYHTPSSLRPRPYSYSAPQRTGPCFLQTASPSIHTNCLFELVRKEGACARVRMLPWRMMWWRILRVSKCVYVSTVCIIRVLYSYAVFLFVFYHPISLFSSI